MLDEAKKDNLYNQFIVEYITGSPLDIPAGKAILATFIQQVSNWLF